MKKILVIEDDREIRDALNEVLSDEGYDVINSPGGQDALNYLRNSTSLPHIIVLDLMMPGMSGQNFRTEQLKNAAWAAIPTVILSADVQVEKKTKEMGLEYSLKKPVELDALLEMIDRLT